MSAGRLRRLVGRVRWWRCPTVVPTVAAAVPGAPLRDGDRYPLPGYPRFADLVNRARSGRGGSGAAWADGKPAGDEWIGVWR